MCSTLRRSLALAGLTLGLATAGAATAQIVIDPSTGASASVRVMSWRDIPFRTVVRQQYDFSCGSAALATLLSFQYGMKTTETEAFQAMYAAGDQAKIRKVGFSMLDMKRYLETRGIGSDGFRSSLDDIARSRSPAIVLINLGRYRHFVVVKGVAPDRVLVGDPALGLKTYSKADFAKIWNGVAFVLASSDRLHPPVFNAAADWAPWSSAPLGSAGQPVPMAELSRNLAPIYQLTPSMRVPGNVPGGVP